MKLTLKFLLLLSLFAFRDEPAPAQHRKPAPKAITYEFISPNTSEDLQLDEALTGLKSVAEAALINEIRIVACRIGVPARIHKSIGVWRDGAENSTVSQI